jgi:hypothetical protein
MLKYIQYFIYYLYFQLAICILLMSPLGFFSFSNSLFIYIFIIPLSMFMLVLIFHIFVMGRPCLENYESKKK